MFFIFEKMLYICNMMRLVNENEIHGIDFRTMLTDDEFINHIPDKYKDLCKHIHHVDTYLNERNNELEWRVQGYIYKEDLDNLITQKDIELQGLVKFVKDKLEIWTLILPYK